MFQTELIVSLAQGGALFGALVAGPLSDAYGRKIVIILADILFTCGAIMMYTAPSITFLMFGRVVIGLGVGIASMVVPIYLTEISPKEIRGTVVAFNVLMLTLG